MVIPREELEGKRCYFGLDLSSTTELTALCCLFPPQEGLDFWYLTFEAWAPADSLRELVILKSIANGLQKRTKSNYRFIMSFNSTLIVLGAMGILPPATSALLHNASTLGVSLKSMTNLLE